MTPVSAIYSASNDGCADAKLIGESLVRSASKGVQPPYLSNLFVIQFCLMMASAARNVLWIKAGWVSISFWKSAFVCRVTRIIPKSPKKQVRRIATSRIVSTGAVMARAQAIWNWAIGKYPREAMAAIGGVPNRKLTIPKGVLAARPQPAGILPARLVNPAPESCDYRRNKWCFVHNQKTPADSGVKSASEGGNRDSGYKLDLFTAFSATSRPVKA